MRAELYVIALDGRGTLSVMARPRGGDWLLDEIQARQSGGRYPRAIVARKAGVYEHGVRGARLPHTTP